MSSQSQPRRSNIRLSIASTAVSVKVAAVHPSIPKMASFKHQLLLLLGCMLCLALVAAQPRRHPDLYTDDEVAAQLDGEGVYGGVPDDLAAWLLRSRMPKRNSELLNTLLGSKNLVALRAAGRR
ncbi:hypothetical protein FHG87_010497 [Trinorchestia longiramus]|nr:hypothetical protein FHG87_010497 [Trinorchestia longiramus]